LQWTGPAQQVQTVGWSLVGEEETASAFAAAIERAPRQLFGGGTSISGAIDYAATLFPISPFAAPRRVIDVSGDGSTNRGRPVASRRRGTFSGRRCCLIAVSFRTEELDGSGHHTLPAHRPLHVHGHGC